MFRPILFFAFVVVGLAATLATEDHVVTGKLQRSSRQSKASSEVTRLLDHSSGSKIRMVEEPSLRRRPSQHDLEHEKQVEDDLYTIRIIIIIIIVFVIILVILVMIIVAFMFQISRAADKIAANGST
ncbi:uncharacterized protein LOC123511303 [Portunus trituberculatus]|uniref:uncharacterized protein LOC123511303 n=1 Tax=Portunus trituberculatus TaxID=210409 RepID=UPI001E1CC9F5|nr:uncharacterized protein LOC123511303 [Portunus trituberculatus]